ncbi:MAG: biliverdin-producing heme oxygenase [Alphaproteobacteria bacterium]|nr:biliverdin-producing heme oxygenase [Alphaproteobacteria bacterium]
MPSTRDTIRSGDTTLRRVLKRETRDSHDRLDAAMGDWPVGSVEGYALFLQTQYRSREPIERWIAQALPADEAPPAQAPLIARDLAELGVALPETGDFALPEGADPIGLVWALAGSSLGNRSMLRQRQKTGAVGPERFLSDTAMTEFFTRLRARIERPASDALAGPAVAGAKAVFAAFIAALPDQTRNADT